MHCQFACYNPIFILLLVESIFSYSIHWLQLPLPHLPNPSHHARPIQLHALSYFSLLEKKQGEQRNLTKSQNKTKQTDKKNENTHEDTYTNTNQETIIDKHISKQQGEMEKKKAQTKQYEIKHLQKYHYKTQYFNLNFFCLSILFSFFTTVLVSSYCFNNGKCQVLICFKNVWYRR